MQNMIFSRSINLKIIVFFSILLGLLGAQAEPRRTTEETKRLLKRNLTVTCELTESYVLQTKAGDSTPDTTPPPVHYLKDAKPEPYDKSDLTSYSYFWESDTVSFYYLSTIQVGIIRVVDNRTQYQAATELDLSDLDKEENQVGSVQTIRIEDIMVTSPDNKNKKVPGEKWTYLTGKCKRAK